MLTGAVGTAVAGGALTACSTLRHSADDGIRQLRDVARMNAEALQDKDIAEFRRSQADVLQAEVVRQCGTFEDGTVPEACQTQQSSLSSVSAPADADDARLLFEAVTSSFGAIKALSGPSAGFGASISTGIMFALQHVDADRLSELTVDTGVGPFQGAELFTSEADVEALAFGLTSEYALLDNLTTLHARSTDPEERAAIAAAQKAHRLIRDAALTSFGLQPKKKKLQVTAPTPAAGYVLIDDMTAEDLANNAVLVWREVVERANSGDLRIWATRLMSSAALAAADLAGLDHAATLANPTPGR